MDVKWQHKQGQAQQRYLQQEFSFLVNTVVGLGMGLAREEAYGEEKVVALELLWFASDAP